MQQQMNSNLAPYVTSSFQRHGLTATTGIVASIAGGVSQLPFAKILNVFGRMEAYILAHALCCFGLILMAVCRNVETYAAAQVRCTCPQLSIASSTGLISSRSFGLLEVEALATSTLSSSLIQLPSVTV